MDIYDKLKFVTGDVSTYTGEGNVDMVVTLHACDTATDYAIEKAVKWGAKVIFTVPCCQHEVNGQIENKELQPLLKYGLIKERMSTNEIAIFYLLCNYFNNDIPPMYAPPEKPSRPAIYFYSSPIIHLYSASVNCPLS